MNAWETVVVVFLIAIIGVVIIVLLPVCQEWQDRTEYESQLIMAPDFPIITRTEHAYMAANTPHFRIAFYDIDPTRRARIHVIVLNTSTDDLFVDWLSSSFVIAGKAYDVDVENWKTAPSRIPPTAYVEYDVTPTEGGYFWTSMVSPGDSVTLTMKVWAGWHEYALSFTWQVQRQTIAVTRKVCTSTKSLIETLGQPRKPAP